MMESTNLKWYLRAYHQVRKNLLSFEWYLTIIEHDLDFD